MKINLEQHLERIMKHHYFNTRNVEESFKLSAEEINTMLETMIEAAYKK